MSEPDRLPLEYATPARTPLTPQPGSRLKFIFYSVVGNVLLLVALAMYLGRTHERSAPTRYSVFGMGQWFTPFEYSLIVLIPAIVGIVLTWRGVQHGRNIT